VWNWKVYRIQQGRGKSYKHVNVIFIGVEAEKIAALDKVMHPKSQRPN
jgi:hypothetical protein